MKGRIRFAMALLSALVGGSLLHPGLAVGNPEGPSGTVGITSITGLGTSQVTINQGTPLGIINWRSFNIAPNELTRFIQPSSSSWTLNRIFDVNPTQILGSLQANGGLILINPNGVVFGPHSQINVNGLVASSLNLTDADFLSGRFGFLDTASNGWVKNYGTINAGSGGVYLLAPNVENSGVITDYDGRIVLTAGTSALLTARPDGRGLFVEVQAPSGTARNLGDLIADGGVVGLYGRVVNQEGLIQANTVRQRNGRIELVASEQVNLKAGSRTAAKGDDQGVSDGGTIIAVADKTKGQATFEKGAVIDVSGGANGGNGGFAEVSGHSVSLGGRFKADAAPGYRGGRLLIDPFDLTVDFDLLNGFSGSGLSDIVFQADHDLTVTAFFDMGTIGALSPGVTGNLRFDAGHDLIFNFATITNDPSGNPLSRWDYTFLAGRDIVLNGTNLLISGGGTMTLRAGQDLKVGSLDFVGDGSFLWFSNLRTVGAQGGNIVLSAGRDLLAPIIRDTTFSALDGNAQTGIRLDGPGDLTINARNFLGTETLRDFSGNPETTTVKNPGFLLSNGNATINLTGDFGQPGGYGVVVLGAMDAGKKVAINAGGSIYMGAIPDRGLFEGADPLNGNANQAFTFSPNNQVALKAGLTGPGDIYLDPSKHEGPLKFSPSLIEIYPASFSAEAPQGNIFIQSDLTFWPSVTGSLQLKARDNIVGTVSVNTTQRIDPFTQQITQVVTESFPRIQLPLSDPSELLTADLAHLDDAIGKVAQHLPAHAPVPVTVQTDRGDIRTLNMQFITPAKKNVLIDAGGDLVRVVLAVSVPKDGAVSVPAGLQALVSHPVQALIHAKGNADLTKPASQVLTFNGFRFASDGDVAIVVEGNLNLSDSSGISMTGLQNFSAATNLANLLDLSIGGSLLMTQSTISTFNGQAIHIHGLGGSDTYVPGNIDVGTNSTVAQNNGIFTGIFTLRGGEVDIKAVGDVNVNKSRIATFGGGDIHIVSTQGNINAGSGARNEVTDFTLDTRPHDQNGNVIAGAGGEVFHALVPGSGIFTFHPDDPLPLNFPEFNDPAITALRTQITLQGFVGHDTTALQNQLTALTAERQKIFQEQIFDPFINGLKLGNIFLTATNPTRTGRVIVPPAGIRGRDIHIEADNLTLEGGTIEGRTSVNVATITGNLSSFVGTFSGTTGAGAVGGSNSGGSSLTPLAGTSGGVAAAGATAGASTTAKKSVESVTETATEATPQGKATTASAKNAETGGLGKNEAKKPALRVKKGVTIAVEVKPEKPL